MKPKQRKKSGESGAPASKANELGGQQAAFAERLKQLIASSGGARPFAAKAAASEGTVRAWVERGAEPSRDKLAAIAKTTGVSLDWLISGRGPKFYSECPPGYAAMRFADLMKSKGKPTRPFFSTEQLIFLPFWLLGIAESEREKIDPMALLLPTETPDSTAADFVVFDLTKEGASPPSSGLCVILDDEGRFKVRAARSAAGGRDIFGPVFGPVIFRGVIVRPPFPKAKDKLQ
jgi:transcriptional regulator with XRE-family HTH domain